MKKACSAIVAVLALVTLFSCDMFSRDRRVKFEGETAGISASVSGWYEVTGVRTDFNSEPSPWSVTVDCQKGDEVWLRVEDAASEAVDVTARIYVDGLLWLEDTGNSGSSEIGMIIP